MKVSLREAHVLGLCMLCNQSPRAFPPSAGNARELWPRRCSSLTRVLFREYRLRRGALSASFRGELLAPSADCARRSGVRSIGGGGDALAVTCMAGRRARYNEVGRSAAERKVVQVVPIARR